MKQTSKKSTTYFPKDSYRILAKNEVVSNNTWITGLNNNDVIIGPSGAGKTRGYVIPNILEMNGSMIVADTKGSILGKVRGRLEQNGYIVQGLDFTGNTLECGYNPFGYIRYNEETDTFSVRDIKTVAAALVPLEGTHDPFWHLAARQVFECLAAYTLECLPKEEQNITSVIKLFRIMGTNAYHRLFHELAELAPDSYAISIYDMIKGHVQAERMYESIRAILSQKLSLYAEESIQKLITHEKQVDFREMGRQKTVLFLTISDTDRSMDELVNLFYTQAFHELCNSADRDYPDGRLKIPVRFFLDDFAANVFIPDFDKTISVIRSREIAVSIILQSLSQLEDMYGEPGAKTILNNCDNCLYLGGQDVETAQYISHKANKSASSILNMSLNDAWLFQRGAEPRQVEKYIMQEELQCE